MLFGWWLERGVAHSCEIASVSVEEIVKTVILKIVPKLSF